MARARLYAEFLHPAPSVLTAVAAVAMALLFRFRSDDPRLLIVFATVLMSQFSISAANEWADRERDAAAHRQRPVALGRIPSRFALILAILFGLAAVLGALAFGVASLAIVMVGLILGWAYDLVLKPTPLSFLPFALAFPLLPFWIGVIGGYPTASLLFLFAVGPPLALAIHLADAIPDRESDQQVKVLTLAVVLHQPLGELVAAGALLTAGLLTLGRLSFGTSHSLDPLSIFLAALTTAVVAGGYLIAMLSPSLISLPVRQRGAKWGLIVWATVLGFFLAFPIARG